MVLFAKSLILWWGLGGLEFACPLLTHILYWSLAALQKLWLTAQKQISKSPKKRSVSRSPSGSRSRSRSLSRSHSSQLCFSFILCSQSLRFWLCTFFFPAIALCLAQVMIWFLIANCLDRWGLVVSLDALDNGEIPCCLIYCMLRKFGILDRCGFVVLGWLMELNSLCFFYLNWIKKITWLDWDN